MEFWGIEVKPGQKVKCEARDKSTVHLSQASLGESKKEKGSENVRIFVKINDQKLVIGTLSADKCAQIQFDLIFEKEFELSHGSNNASVFFVGYKRVNKSDKFEDSFDDSSSADDLDIYENANGKPYNELVKLIGEKATTKLKANIEKPKKELVKVDKMAEDKDSENDSNEDVDEDNDKNDSEEDSDGDEEINESSGDSSEEDEDDSSEEEIIPVKFETDKKRKADSASKTPIPGKKAKVVTPIENHKAGGDGKKAHVHVATPYPAKQGGKPQQSSKSGGSVACKSCNRTFNSKNALQAHRKSKHGDAAN